VKPKFTYDDFVQFPDDGRRHELIDGDHYSTPSPNIRHQRISGNLTLMIARVAPEGPDWQDLLCAARRDPVELRRGRARSSVRLERKGPTLLAGEYVTGAPDLLIEIAPPETRQRDETIKRRLYERWNVLEYWVVDQEIDVIRVYRRDGNRFARPVELSREAGDVLTTPLFPGLDIPLSHVFGD